MKRFSKTLVAALIIVATTAAFMVGCKKEQDTRLTDNGQIEQNDKRAEAAIARITDFKKQVDIRKTYPGMKSADTVSISEAAADIVELFNAVYAQPEYFYVQMVRQFHHHPPVDIGGQGSCGRCSVDLQSSHCVGTSSLHQ